MAPKEGCAAGTYTHTHNQPRGHGSYISSLQKLQPLDEESTGQVGLERSRGYPYGGVDF